MSIFVAISTRICYCYLFTINVVGVVVLAVVMVRVRLVLVISITLITLRGSVELSWRFRASGCRMYCFLLFFSLGFGDSLVCRLLAVPDVCVSSALF